jgi:hypothetical protein
MAMSVATTKHLTAIGLLDINGDDPGTDEDSYEQIHQLNS